jgi:hypothetical protein
MPRRLLNIASIVCLVLCVVLMAMWVRSYDYSYVIGSRLSPSTNVHFEAGEGTAGFTTILRYVDVGDWYVDSEPVDIETKFAGGFGFWRSLGFGVDPSPVGTGVWVPYWFVVLVCGLLGFGLRLPWPPRFTLRSLFIAITFLAVVLGMIAWLDRAWIGK